MELQKDQVSTVRKEVLDVGSEVELRNILLSGHQDSIVRGKLWIQELLILAQKPPLPLQILLPLCCMPWLLSHYFL